MQICGGMAGELRAGALFHNDRNLHMPVSVHSTAAPMEVQHIAAHKAFGNRAAVEGTRKGPGMDTPRMGDGAEVAHKEKGVGSNRELLHQEACGRAVRPDEHSPCLTVAELLRSLATSSSWRTRRGGETAEHLLVPAWGKDLEMAV